MDILRDGVIRPSDFARDVAEAKRAGRDPDAVRRLAEASIGERAAVWFSSADPWEPTASKVVNDDGTDETTLAAHQAITAVFRIGVAPETVPLGWAAWRGQSGATPETVAGLRRVAKRLGADPMRWRVSFEPVPRERWVRVEVWDGTWSTDNPTTFERELARAETVAADMA